MTYNLAIMGCMWRNNPHFQRLMRHYSFFNPMFGLAVLFAFLTIISVPVGIVLLPLNCGTMVLFLLICVITISMAALRTSVDARDPAYDLVLLTGIRKRRLLGGYIASELLMQSPFAAMAILIPALDSLIIVTNFIPEQYFALAIYIAVPGLWLFALMMGISTGLAFRRPMMSVSVGLVTYGLSLLLWSALLLTLASRLSDVLNNIDGEFRFRMIAEWFFLTAFIPYVFLAIIIQVASEDVTRPNTNLDDYIYEDVEW